MKAIWTVSLAAILALSATSCDREKFDYNLGTETTTGKTGTLDLSTFGAIPNNDTQVVEKAPVSRAVDTGDFTVQIYPAQGNDTLEWKYREMPEIVTLNVGDYKLAVFSHDVQPAEWERPYYYADKAFTIEDNRVTQLDTVVCTLQNIKVTVTYSEDLKSFMGEGCKVTVDIGSGSLEFSQTETRAGYFRSDSESNLLIATFTGTIDGYEEVNRIQVDNVKAGEWRKIHYDIKRPEPGSETGGVTPSVTVDASCEIIDHEGNVVIDEEVIPDPNPSDPGTDPDPEPEPSGAPQISSETIALGPPVTVTDGMQVVVDIISTDKDGLTQLTVDIESPTLTPEELSGMGLSAHLDLVNPGALKEAIEGLGFPTENKVLHQNKVTFDISQFMPLLGLLGAGTHNFIITATDAQGTTTESLILVTE